MEITVPKLAHSDDRGSIRDLVTGLAVEHVAFFTCTRGSVRGGHYHKESTSWIYLVSGVMRVRVRGAIDSVVTEATISGGNLLRLDPGDRHTLEALTPSAFIMLTHGPQGGRQYLDDTVREMP